MLSSLTASLTSSISSTSTLNHAPSYKHQSKRVKFSKPSMKAASLGATQYSELLSEFTAIDTDGSGKYVVAATESDGTYYSSDYGQTFSNSNCALNYEQNSISVSNDSPYVLFGGQNGLYLSSDYGVSCSFVSGLPWSQYTSVALSDNGQYAYAAISGIEYLYSSSNYSTNFQPLNQSAYQDNYLSVATSSTGQYVYAVSYAKVYSSSNYGASWASSTLTNALAISTSSDGKYVVVANLYGLYVSSNYGASYSGQITLDYLSTPNFVSMSSTGQYIAVSTQDSAIYTSSDYGKTFVRTLSGSEQWQAVTISSSGQDIYACVDQGYIYRSTDFGATWTPNFYDWVDVATSSDGQTSYAITGYTFLNFVYRKTNGSDTWDMVDTIPNYDYDAIACDATCEHIVIIADNSFILISSDSGVTWTSKTITVNTLEVALQDVTVSETGQYMAICVNSDSIYYSVNYGSTWTKSNAQTLNWWAITSSASGQYLAATVGYYSYYQTTSDGGYIYLSNDYGATWTQSSAPFLFLWASVSSDSTGQHLVATAGYGGSIYYSHDYGTTWVNSNDISNNWVSSASSAQGDIVYATSGGGPGSVVGTGNIYVSKDYGVTWNETISPQLEWDSIACDNSGQYVTASVFMGQIYTSSDFGLTWNPANITITSYNNNGGGGGGTTDNSNSNALSDGEIAGIVLGSIAGVLIIAGAIAFFFFGASFFYCCKKDSDLSKNLM